MKSIKGVVLSKALTWPHTKQIKGHTFYENPKFIKLQDAMRLVHDTSAKAIEAIKTNGLDYRKRKKAKGQNPFFSLSGNWFNSYSGWIKADDLASDVAFIIFAPKNKVRKENGAYVIFTPVPISWIEGYVLK